MTVHTWTTENTLLSGFPEIFGISKNCFKLILINSWDLCTMFTLKTEKFR